MEDLRIDGLCLQPLYLASVYLCTYAWVLLQTCNHSYTFFLEEVQIIYDINLHFFLNHIFLKYVMVFHFIYIYIYIYKFRI